MSLGQIERTGRKRRRKRLILILAGVGALALGGLVVTALGPASGASRTVAATEAAPVEPEYVTEEAADQAQAEAEAMQTLVSDLGTAVVEAGITDMGPLESLMAQAVDMSSAAEEMLDAVDLGAEDSARSARTRFNTAVRDGKVAAEAVLQQLRSAGVDLAALRQAASE